jgi:thiol:disulfide interchange protein DsbD
MRQGPLARPLLRGPLEVGLAVAAFISIAPRVSSATQLGSDTGAFERALAHGPFVAVAASYVFGLATSLTPCVYPMIAITVSVFGAKHARSRTEGTLLSLAFVMGIVSLFTPMGVASALTGKGFGSALGNPLVVGALALVFAALAASLFGAFEVALPSGLANRLASVGGRGYRGAYGLGLVCGLVAAPCVGPFLFGLLGWIATTRNALLGSMAMASYGLGLGTLFFLVGAFAVNLPKAGSWMLGVKWAGGVTIAAMALGYVRDGLPSGARTLIRPGPVAAVFGVVGLAIGLVLAILYAASERPGSRLAHRARALHIASIAPAVFGVFTLVTFAEMPLSGAFAAGETLGGAPPLLWESNETTAVRRAATEHRPLLVDFGAAWCAACHELERITFADTRVRISGARYVPLHIDATDEDDAVVASLRRKYRVTEGLPVVLLVGSDGKEAVRFTEFVAPDRFAKALDSVK